MNNRDYFNKVLELARNEMNPEQIDKLRAIGSSLSDQLEQHEKNSLHRSTMSTAEKVEFINSHGHTKFMRLPD
jgi:hypothetical protein